MAESKKPQTGQDEISKFIFFQIITSMTDDYRMIFGISGESGTYQVVYRCPYCEKVLFLRKNKYFYDYVMECKTKVCYYGTRFGNLHEFRDRLKLLEEIRASQKKIAFAVPPPEAEESKSCEWSSKKVF